MSIDDLAHEAEVEAEVLRVLPSLGVEKAERLLIALAFKIKQTVPRAAPVELLNEPPDGWVPPICAQRPGNAAELAAEMAADPRAEVDPLGLRSASRPMHAVQLSPEWNEPIEVPTRAPAGTLGELSKRIVDFLERVGGTSAMGGIKDACATSKWSRNRVGTEVFNLVHRGMIVRLIALP